MTVPLSSNKHPLMMSISPNTIPCSRNDGVDGEKKRLKATSTTISLRTFHRLDDMMPMLEPNADVHAALRASKRPKKD
jgi:hypothetical protein